MTARISTALGALALGFGVAGALPVLAQTNPTSPGGTNTGTTAPAPAPTTPPATGQTGTEPTGAGQAGANPAGGTMGANTNPSTPSNEQGTGTNAPAPPTGAENEMPGAHATQHATTTHHPMHHRTRTASRGDTGDSMIEQLNAQSLAAAQRGQTFSPSGMQSSPGMGSGSTMHQ
jgi:hypothetical protein